MAAADHDRDKLGFAHDRLWGEPPGADLLPHWRVVRQRWNAYFWGDDVEALYAEYRESGATIDQGLSPKPYGVKEFGVQDLDGHDIAFGETVRGREGRRR